MDQINGKTIMVIDTEYETNPKRMLSISYTIYSQNSNESVTHYIYHPSQIFEVDTNSTAFKYHKLTNEFLKKNGLPISEVLSHLSDKLDMVDIIVGQNIISADISAIRKEAMGSNLWFNNLRNKIKSKTIYDTMFAFRDKHPEESSSLDNIFRFLFKKEMTDHHNATYDCTVTYQCFQKMLELGFKFKKERIKFSEDIFDNLMKECINCDVCSSKIDETENSFKFKTNKYCVDNMMYVIMANFLDKDQVVCMKCVKKIEMMILEKYDKSTHYMKNLVKLKSYDNMISKFFEIIGEEPIIVYLDSQYKDKDVIKKLGGRWDGSKKKWYFTYTADTENIIDKFKQWIPQNVEV